MSMVYRTFVDKLKGTIAKVLKLDPEQLDEHENLIELGADSIILSEVRSVIKNEYGTNIPVSQFFGKISTVTDIANHILSMEGLRAPDQVAQIAQTAPPLAPPKAPPKSPQIPVAPPAVQSIPDTPPPVKPVPPKYQLVTSRNMMEAINSQISQIVPPQDKTVIQDLKNDSSFALNSANNEVFNAQKRETCFVYEKSNSSHKTKLQKKALEELEKRYVEKTGSSKAHVDRYRKPYADCRNVAGFRLNMKEMIFQLVCKNADGSKVVDIDDNEYIDIAMSFGLALFGHNPGFITKAIDEELKTGFPLSLISRLTGEVSELICELTGVERVAFFNSGTEAVMVAMRLARAVTKKNKIAIFAGAYHGTFDGVLGLQGNSIEQTVPMTIGILPNMVNDIIVLDYDDEQSLQIIAEQSSELAAVLVEPVQSRNPGLQPVEFLKKLRVISEQNDIAMIFDEVITGFRISSGGAQEYFGIQADIVTYGKIVGGGLPIGIVAGKSRFIDAIDGGVWYYGDDSIPPNEDNRTFVAGTFCHHPLAMASAKAVLQRIKEEKDTIYRDLNEKTLHLVKTLNAYFEVNEIPIKVSNFGSLFRFSLKGNLEAFYYYLLCKGIYIWEGRNCFISVAHSDEDVNQIIRTVIETCEEMRGVFWGSVPENTSPIKNESIALNSNQQAMVSKSLLSQTASAFHESVLLRLEDEIDLVMLNRALSDVVQRHQYLQLILSEDDSSLITKNEMQDEIEVIKVNAINDETILNLIRHPFDIHNGPLYKLYLIDTWEGQYLLAVIHHLIADGWSISLFFEELIALYNSTDGEPASLREVVSIDEFIKDEKELIDSANQENIVSFWTKYLASTVGRLELPPMHYTASEINRGNRCISSIPIKTIERVKKASSSLHCSPFMVLLAAFQIVLQHNTGCCNFTIGIPYAKQLRYSGEKTIMGNWAVMLPVACLLINDAPASILVKQNQQSFASFEKVDFLFKELEDKRITELTPEMNVVFNMDAAPQNLSFAGAKAHLLRTPIDTVKHDLFLNITDLKSEYLLDMDYNSAKFSQEQVTMWLDSYITILDQIAAAPHVLLCDVMPVSPAGEEKIMSRSMICGVKNTCTEFSDLIAKLASAGQITFHVLDSNGRLAPLGAYGKLYVKINQTEIVNTNWIARHISTIEIELFGKADEIVYIGGNAISFWLIEQAYYGFEGICSVSAQLEKGTIALIIEMVGKAVTANSLFLWGQERLPTYMIPKKYYRRKNGEITQIAYQIDTKDELERAVYDICSDVTRMGHFDADADLISSGVNSLMLIEIIAEIQKQYNVRVTFSQLKDGISIRTLTRALYEHFETNDQQNEIIVPFQSAPYFEASLSQKRLFIAWQMASDSLNYNLPFSMDIKGAFDTDAFSVAMDKVIKKHESLRTCFSEIDGQIIQIVNENVMIGYEYAQLPIGMSKEEFLKEQKRDFVRPFDLKTAPLFRMRFLKLGEDSHVVIGDIHHIVFDGASGLVMLKDMKDALTLGYCIPAKIQYKDFSAWQNQQFATDVMDGQREYWKKKFETLPAPLNLIYDFKRPAIQSFAGDRVYHTFWEKEVISILDYCREYKCTPSTFFLAALGVMLRAFTNQQDIVMGLTLEARNHFQLSDIVGLFANVVPVRLNAEGAKSFSEFLIDTQKEALETFDNSDLQLNQIAELISAARDQQRNPLFDIMFTYQDFMVDDMVFPDFEVSYKEFYISGSKTDLAFEILRKGMDIELNLEYCTALFKKETVELLLSHYVELIKNVIKNPKAKLKELGMITDDEKRKIKDIFNSTAAEYPRDKTIVQMFEEQVEKTPENVAVVFKDERLTYCELNRKANVLAHKLRGMGVGPDDYVAIIAQRSIEMIVGIYGIIKSGGAYVPIDPTYPEDRIQYMLEDSNPKVAMLYKVAIETEIPLIDLGNPETWNGETENPERVNKPEDAVYLIYTSGSTGNPKGVINRNYGLINRIMWMHRRYPLLEQDAILQKTTYSFDVSVWEIVWWSLVGSKVVLLPPGGEKEPETICEEIFKNKVTVLHFVPSMMNVMVAHLENNDDEVEKFQSVKYIFASGEALNHQTANAIIKIFGQKLLLANFYGPTEASIDVTYYDCIDPSETVPIGKPIDNTQIHIMSGDVLCGIGVPGELCIAGDGLARGYLNRPELTAEKFVDNPFDGGKMYRTGDLARWLPDGNIDFLGRIDDQVKIRGFRIELGEIESAIRKIETVDDCVVIAKEDSSNDKAICAYIVSGAEVSIQNIRETLGKTLPEYMIPAHIAQIDTIPVTRNGKLDRRALPEIETKAEKEYVAPSTQIEEKICKVFEEVLGIKKVGIRDNFFELGGDSIKAIRIVSKVREQGYTISIMDVMKELTVERIARKAKEGLDFKRYEQGEVLGDLPLSPIQRRFYSWDLYKPNHFNQSFMFSSTKRIDKSILEKTIIKLCEHHDILRAIYANKKQRIRGLKESRIYNIRETDLYGMGETDEKTEIERINEEIQRSFDIEKGPLFGIGLYKTDKCDYLFLCLHHLLVDGVSWRIILEDFEHAYSRYENNKEVRLAHKTASYKEWAEALEEYSQSTELKKENEYWKTISHEAAGGKLEARKSNEFEYAEVETKLDQKMTWKLVYEAGKTYGTELTELLLTALGMAVKKWTGQDKVTIDLEGHGREAIHKPLDISRTVGWFTSIYPVVLSTTENVEESIIEVKEMLRHIPNKGMGYSVLRYFCPDSVPNTKADIAFNYLGDLDAEITSTDNLLKRSEMPSGRDSAGDNLLQNDIMINSAIIENMFSTIIIYNTFIYDPNSIDELLMLYRDALHLIVMYCVNNYKLFGKIDKQYFQNEISSSIITQQNEMRLIDLNRENIEAIEDEAKHAFYAYDSNIIGEEQEANYEALSFQMYYIQLSGLICGTIQIDTRYSLNEIVCAVNHVIKEQSSLRSICDGQKIVEYTKNNEWSIYCFDVSGNTESKEALINCLEKLGNEYPVKEKQNKLLSKQLIIKISPRHYMVYLFVDHSIWDSKSFEIWGDRVLYYLNGGFSEKTKSFSSFIKNTATRKSNSEEIITKYSHFIDCATHYSSLSNRKREKCVVHCRIDICDVSPLFLQNPVGMSMNLLKDNIVLSLKQSDLPINIPILIVHHNRNLENQRIAGFFANYTPYLLEVDEKGDAITDVDSIEKLIKEDQGLRGLDTKMAKKMKKAINITPKINVVIRLLTGYDEEFYADAVKTYEDLLMKCDYIHAEDMQLLISQKEVIAIIVADKENRDVMQCVLESMLTGASGQNGT